MLRGGRHLDSEIIRTLDQREPTSVVVVLHAGFATMSDEFGKHAIGAANVRLFDALSGLTGTEVASISLIAFVVVSFDDEVLSIEEVRGVTDHLSIEYFGTVRQIDVALGIADAPTGVVKAIEVASKNAKLDFLKRFASRHEAPPEIRIERER